MKIVISLLSSFIPFHQDFPFLECQAGTNASVFSRYYYSVARRGAGGTEIDVEYNDTINIHAAILYRRFRSFYCYMILCTSKLRLVTIYSSLFIYKLTLSGLGKIEQCKSVECLNLGEPE